MKYWPIKNNNIILTLIDLFKFYFEMKCVSIILECKINKRKKLSKMSTKKKLKWKNLNWNEKIINENNFCFLQFFLFYSSVQFRVVKEFVKEKSRAEMQIMQLRKHHIVNFQNNQRKLQVAWWIFVLLLWVIIIK